MQIEREDALRPKVAAAVQRLSAELSDLLPNAKIEHIGATAVPGALTKGDLDLLVRVPADGFAPAVDALGSRFAPHFREEWTADLASFKEEPEVDLPVGIQLVIRGGRSDRLFLRWRDLLRENHGLLGRFNEFKLTHSAMDYAEYTEAKAGFIEQALGESLDER